MKNFYLSISLLCLIVISGYFYWFEYRPSTIKHNCSWVKTIIPFTPAKDAITSEDVENSKQEFFDCLLENADLIGRRRDVASYIGEGKINPTNNLDIKERIKFRVMMKQMIREFNLGEKTEQCINLLKKETPASPEIPASVVVRKAYSYEYDFCIHDKGL